MSEESSPAPGLAASKDQAEDLEWMGSAYGRPEDAAARPAAGRFSLSGLSRQAKSAVAGRERIVIGALVVVLTFVSTLAILRALARA